MAVDFSNVQVGDRVKLSRENGDEYTFTVEIKRLNDNPIESQTNVVYKSDWDSLEILAKPLPTVNGSVIKLKNSNGITYHYALVGGRWVAANYGNDVHHSVTEDCKVSDFEVMYVPETNN